MKRKKYFIIAILIAVLMTVIQSMIANMSIRKKEQTVYVAAEEIHKGTVMEPYMTEEIRIYSDVKIDCPDLSDIAGRIALKDLPKNSILKERDFISEEASEDVRFLSVNVDISNFNAGNLRTQDIVDLFIIPDLKKTEEFQLKWLIQLLDACNISYIPGVHGGIMIENITIDHISSPSGQGRQNVSIRVKKPLDEVISFLQHTASLEFIRK